MYKEILTNPNQHDPNNFIYLVHAITDVDGTSKRRDRSNLEWRINRIKNPDLFYPASIIGKLEAETAEQIYDVIIKSEAC